jgi:uncharacterized membrane protein
VAPDARLLLPDPTLPYDPANAMLFPVGQQITHWQGPYPPPEAAERFEALLPGSFGRIIAMAEQSQAAQIAAVSRAQDYLQRDTSRGQWLGSVVSIIAMAGGAVCAVAGQPWVAGLFLGVPVLAVAKALIDGVARRPTPQASPAPPNEPTS